MPHLQLPMPAVRPLNDQFPLFSYLSTGHPAVVLDIFWRAGERYGKGGIPYIMGKMLSKGTLQRSAVELAEAFEQYGAQLNVHVGKETIHIQLSSIPDYFEQVLPVLAEMLRSPIFPQAPLTTLKSITSKQLAQKLADPSFLAHSSLRSLIFGDHHPYGHTLTQEEIKAVTPKALKVYHQSHAWHDSLFMISGSVAPSSIEELQKLFAPIEAPARIELSHIPTSGAQEKEIPHLSSLQTTLALGHPTITQSHPDYPELFITNSLLGGYFGSRLMRTIREEKGYTYGIYSRLVPWIEQGYWYISTSVKKEVAQETREAIRKEIEVLQTSLVKEKELATLKSYLMGQLLSLFQTPFALADRFAHATFHGLTIDYYTRLYEMVQHITPEQIQSTAQRYFQIDRLHTVSVLPPERS